MEQEMNNRSIGRKAFLSFFGIVILISVVVETLICRGGTEWLYAVLMWIYKTDTYAYKKGLYAVGALL